MTSSKGRLGEGPPLRRTRLPPRHASASSLPARGVRDVASLGSRPDHTHPLHLHLWFAFLFGFQCCFSASPSWGLSPRPSSVAFGLPPALPRSPGSPPAGLLPVSAAPAKPRLSPTPATGPGLCLSPKRDFFLQAVSVFPFGAESSSRSFYPVLRFCEYLSLCHTKPLCSLHRLRFNTLPLESRGIVVTGDDDDLLTAGLSVDSAPHRPRPPQGISRATRRVSNLHGSCTPGNFLPVAAVASP